MKSQLLMTFAFAIIVTFFLFTRLYKIPEIPPSLYWDEASIGYNAYSILKTGKDEWGEPFPLHFRAFGEFKLPIYIYSVTISEAIFGVNEFAVRFPAVIYSLGVIIASYLLVLRISGNKRLGLLSVFLITISPWLFIFSRTGYEATSGLMFLLLGLYFLVLSFEKGKIWYLVLATVSWILSIYSYNSYRVIIPIIYPLSLVYFFFQHKKDMHKFKILALSVVIIVISVFPIWRLLRYDAGVNRFSAVKITKLTDFAQNYLSHFTPSFLLINGDINIRSQIPGFGQIYLIELPFIILGIVGLIRSKWRYRLVPLFMLAIAPIPASITKESPHALRSLTAEPFLSAISAVGISKFLEWSNKYKTLFTALLIIVFLAFFENYYVNFIDNYAKLSSEEWQYGYKKIFTEYKDEFAKFDRVIISDEYAQPYIFALFYLKYDPNDFINTVKYNSVDNWGFSTVGGFGKFKFGKANKIELNPKTLVFASERDKLVNDKPDSEIKFLSGETAFWVYKI